MTLEPVFLMRNELRYVKTVNTVGGRFFVFSRRHVIEWGECDALGIIFYPNYFRWMDATFHAFTRSEDFDQLSLKADFDIEGTPLVDVACSFKSPGRYYEEMRIDLVVRGIGRSSVELAYRFAIGDRLTAEGREKRAFVAIRNGKLSGEQIPAAIRAKLEKYNV
ncbi:MAG: acyl-CoA thioesterase [Devosiaceae bacterium]|nr:acyl-CoA thioesterase [Devosiaceae bacterium MH13]